MELTFQYEKEVCDGTNSSVAVMNDETLCLVYNSGNVIAGRLIGIDTSNADNSIIGDEFVVSNNSITPIIATEITSAGGQNWLTLRTETKQKVVSLTGGGEEFTLASYYVNKGLVQLI